MQRVLRNTGSVFAAPPMSWARDEFQRLNRPAVPTYREDSSRHASAQNEAQARPAAPRSLALEHNS